MSSLFRAKTGAEGGGTSAIHNPELPLNEGIDPKPSLESLYDLEDIILN